MIGKATKATLGAMTLAVTFMSMEPSENMKHLRRTGRMCVDAESRRKALLNRKRRKAERQRRK